MAVLIVAALLRLLLPLPLQREIKDNAITLIPVLKILLMVIIR